MVKSSRSDILEFSWSCNERRINVLSYYPKEMIDSISLIIRELRPIVLNTALWKCRYPWRVPERRCCDNLFLLVLEGREEIIVAGERRVLRRGDAVMIPAFVPHTLAIAPRCRKCRHFIAHVLSENLLGGNPFAGFSSPFIKFEFADALIADVTMAARMDTEIAALLMIDIFRRIMLAEILKQRFHFSGAGIGDGRIRAALDFLRENFKRKLTVGEMAAVANFGEVRFRMLFKREIGISPMAYLLRVRILHAASGIVRSGWSVKEAAFQSGFSGECYFCTAFRRIMHVTPAEYRRSFFQS